MTVIETWVEELQDYGPRREAAVERLHELLLAASRKEVRRRAASTPSLRGEELDGIARQGAGDALVGAPPRLDPFRGLSRFTPWAYRFAILEAAVAMRRRAW